MIQNIIALFIVFLAVAYTLWQIILFFRNANSSQKGCSCSGCGLSANNDILKKIKTKK